MEPTAVDVFLRQQIYFEAVKDYEADQAETLTDEIVAAMLGVLLRLGYTSFAGVPKSKLTLLLRQTKDAIGGKFASMSDDLFTRMQQVLAATLTVTKQNYQFVTGNPKPITANNFDGSKGGNKALWKRLTGELVPGIGISPTELVTDFVRSATTQITTLIKRAYVENWTVDQLMTAVKGSARLGFKDGLGRRLTNQLKTVTRTMMQHIQSFLDYNIGRMFYDRYQWLSTIDSATTEICRSRHMRIYEYGKGPRPPAHHNCRSKIVGMTGDLANQIGKTYFGWLTGQPREFLRDTMSPAEYRALNSGSARSKDFTAFRNTKRLTPAQFGRKVPMMQLPTTEQ